jgi:hypothetical protein
MQWQSVSVATKLQILIAADITRGSQSTSGAGLSKWQFIAIIGL